MALGKTVRSLLAEITSYELTEWQAYYAIEPFGEERSDLRAGIIASVTANHSMSPPTDPRRPSDYMFFVDKRKEGPVLLQDKKAQSDLIKRAVFGKKEE